MIKQINLTIESCRQCPYASEGITKGLPNGEFHCLQVYDKRENFQGSYRSLGNQYAYGDPIPLWCPLPDVNTLSEALSRAQQQIKR